MHQHRHPPHRSSGFAEATAGLLTRWRARAAALDWPEGIPWDVEATTGVVHACVDGGDLTGPLRSLADQRFDQAATPAELDRDISGLADCLADGSAAVSAGEVTRLAKEAADWVIARDHTQAQLVDPMTSLRTRTAFLADLTRPGSCGEAPCVWVARWRSPRSVTARVAVASALGVLGKWESAACLGPCTLAVLVTDAARARELEAIVGAVPDVASLETALLQRPEGDAESLASWLVSSFPELVHNPLP